MNVPEEREAFDASWKVLGQQADAAMRAETVRHEAIIQRAWDMEGAGCRAVALDPPSVLGRCVIEFHEWPPHRLFRRLLRDPQARCYCGRSKR